jgi:hypothetical protein
MTPFQQTDPSGLKLGERLTLTCAVTKGDLPLSFRWTVDGRPVVSSPGGSLKTVQIDPYTNLLSVDSLQPAHSGNYTCSVDNSAITAHSATTPTTASSTGQRQSQLVLIQGIFPIQKPIKKNKRNFFNHLRTPAHSETKIVQHVMGQLFFLSLILDMIAHILTGQK